MASLDSGVLSYSDLLLKLDEFGSPVNPLIGATRYTVIKRLKHVMQSKSSDTCNHERFRRLSRYSSGEEDSDAEQKVSPFVTEFKITSCVQNSPDHRNSRLMTPTSPPECNSYSWIGIDRPHQSEIRGFTVSSTSASSDTDMLSQGKRTAFTNDPTCIRRRLGASQVRVCRSSRSQCDSSKIEDDFETGSDSDDPGSVTCKRNQTEFSVSDIKPTNAGVSSQAVLSESGVRVALDRLRSTNISSDSPSCSRPSKNEASCNEGTRFGCSPVVTDPVVEKEHPSVNGVLSEYRSTVAQRSLDLTQEFKTSEERVWISLHYQKISMILVAIVFLFFLGLTLMYINVRFKENDLFVYQENGDSYPICDHVDKSENMCILQERIKPTLEALEILSPKLMALATDAYCDNNNSSSGGLSCILMTEEEAVGHLVKSLHMEPFEAKECFKALKVVVLSNPSWAVSVSDCSSEELPHSNEHIRELVEKGGLAVRNPVIPVTCLLKQLVFRLANWVSFLMTTSMAVTGLLFGVWRYKNYQEVHRQEMYLIVNKIIAMVKAHHERMQLPGAVSSNYISVQQCKEEILSPGCRASLVTAWKDAEKFIEKNESRILSDFKQVGGRFVRVWQWVPTTAVKSWRYNGTLGRSIRPCQANVSGPEALDASTALHNGVGSSSSLNRKTRRSKVWQGQAFDTMAGSPNSLPCSPTPCLKIRHMFDPSLEHGEDWPVLIQDAILEKCEGINILHIFVDCNSFDGCVFMKCSNHEEAGKAYRALHGWWFDTKLVTVKYLRTERYHERFPEAAKATVPLRPSNTLESSLQELWHFI